MAGILKHWRESASLIMASRRVAVKQPEQNFMSKFLKKKPEPTEKTNEEHLRLLLLQRSSGSSFMPNVFVFPGGTVDNPDFSKEWMDLFKRKNDLMQLFTDNNRGSPIFIRERGPDFSDVPGEIALRITAIRETFEESGILLARPESEVMDHLSSSNSHPLESRIYEMPEDISVKWRTKIVSDPSQFIVMCKEMELVPDIFSLYEWSNWLTPVMLRNKRFDTAFFVSCVDSGPHIYSSSETEKGMWIDPYSMLQASSHGAVALAPPQVYELSRFSRFASVDDLLTLAWKRSSHRVDRWMPVVNSCADGILFLMPGDDLYPENPDWTGEETPGSLERKETFEELQRKYPKQHRAIIYHEDKSIALFCNILFIDGHVLPLEFNKKSEIQPKW